MAKRRTCFILAGSVPPSELLEGLREAGFEPVQPDELPLSGPLPEKLVAAVSKADAVCVFLSGESEPPTLWFELGLSKAFSKPLAIVVPEGRESVPVIVQGERLISFRKGDSAKLAKGLGHALSHATPKTVGSARLAGKRVSVPEAARLARKIETGESVAEKDVVAAVEVLLRRAGASLVEKQSGSADVGVDLAAWFDATQSSLGNPVVVEVKRVGSRHDLLLAQSQLGGLLSSQRFGAGLLVYYPSLPDMAPEATAQLPISVTISMKQLVELVKGGALLQRLVHLRNVAAHGKQWPRR